MDEWNDIRTLKNLKVADVTLSFYRESSFVLLVWKNFIHTNALRQEPMEMFGDNTKSYQYW